MHKLFPTCSFSLLKIKTRKKVTRTCGTWFVLANYYLARSLPYLVVDIARVKPRMKLISLAVSLWITSCPQLEYCVYFPLGVLEFCPVWTYAGLSCAWCHRLWVFTCTSALLCLETTVSLKLCIPLGSSSSVSTAKKQVITCLTFCTNSTDLVYLVSYDINIHYCFF